MMNTQKKTSKQIITEINNRLNNIGKKINIVSRDVKDIKKYVDNKKNTKFRW